MSDDEMPPLDDFSDEIKSIQYNKPKDYGSEDYTKANVRHLEDEKQQNKQIHEIQEKVEKMNIKIQKEKEKKSGSGYGGMKKGFLSGGSQPKKTEPKIPEIKPQKKQNPLEIKQVQEAMNMNDYLDKTRSEWMTQNFLQQITSNSKVGKLFSNPQYMKAIDLFKTNPKQAMARYGNNREFMEGFQQFCKMMGMQFQKLSGKQ